jgi:DNA modification methylase
LKALDKRRADSGKRRRKVIGLRVAAKAQPKFGSCELLQGDVLKTLEKVPSKSVALVVTSPPYNIGKSYERGDHDSFESYLKWQDKVIAAVVRCLKPNGSVCWQVGNYIKDGTLTPLDIALHPLFVKHGLKLRNRIIWKFNFGLHANRRFSGRYETVLWMTKGDEYKFNLDPVRIPQLYPGKRHAMGKGKNGGKPSGNPKGKNPSDFWEFSADKDFIENPIWDVPNVKSKHPEKTAHPCQFPVELAERCVLAFTSPNNTVLDPFVGVGSAAIAAVKHGRNAIGIDKNRQYLGIAAKRIASLRQGNLPLRPLGKPVMRPPENEKVAQIPEEWRKQTTRHEGRTNGGSNGEKSKAKKK